MLTLCLSIPYSLPAPDRTDPSLPASGWQASVLSCQETPVCSSGLGVGGKCHKPHAAAGAHLSTPALSTGARPQGTRSCGHSLSASAGQAGRRQRHTDPLWPFILSDTRCHPVGALDLTPGLKRGSGEPFLPSEKRLTGPAWGNASCQVAATKGLAWYDPQLIHCTPFGDLSCPQVLALAPPYRLGKRQ